MAFLRNKSERGNEPELFITNVAFADAGPYSVVLTNASGSVHELGGNVDGHEWRADNYQPTSKSGGRRGAGRHVYVGASGSEMLWYLWRFNGTNISTATGTSYTRAAAQVSDAGNYSVVVSNSGRDGDECQCGANYFNRQFDGDCAVEFQHNQCGNHQQPAPIAGNRDHHRYWWNRWQLGNRHRFRRHCRHEQRMEHYPYLCTSAGTKQQAHNLP